MNTLDKCLSALSENERDTYVCYLREVVGGPAVGGYGQYIGSLRHIVFATDDQKLEALRRMQNGEKK